MFIEFLKRGKEPTSQFPSGLPDPPQPQVSICRAVGTQSGITCLRRWPMKESYTAQNSLELKLPSGSSLPFYAKQRTLSPEEKKWTLRLIMPSSQPVPASGPSPEFLAPAI